MVHTLKQYGLILLVSLTVILGNGLAVSQAHAQSGAYSQTKQRCEQIRQQVESSDKDKAFVVEYIVMCTKTVLREVFKEFLNGFYPAVKQIIVAALTLSVTLFGVLLITGMVEKSSRDSFVLLFKLGCVLFFVEPSTVEQIYDMGNDAMDGLTDIVFQFGKGSGGSGRCIDNDTLWDRMDCMLDVLIGTVKGGGGATSDVKGISRGLMHFHISSVASTGMGALIGLIGFYVTYQMLFAAIKSIHTYLAAIMALSFILVFAPMFIPMIMFKATRTYFDKWHRIATSFVLQPVILFGFLSLMLIALEDVLIENQGSYMKSVCGEECAQYGKYPSKVLTDKGALGTGFSSTRGSIGDASERVKGTADGGVLGKGHPTADPKKHIVSDFNFGKHWAKVIYKEQAKLTGKGDETAQQKATALAAVTLALTAFVFISMLNYIPNLATDLAGGIYEVPNLYKHMGSQIPGGQQIQQATSRFAGNITSGAQGYLKSIQSSLTRR